MPIAVLFGQPKGPRRFHVDAIAGVEGRDAPVGPPGVDDYIGFKIAEGERRVATAV